MQDGSGSAAVVVVAKRGVVRPTHRDDGAQVQSWRGAVPADGPAAIPVTVPREFRKPYWLCCFLADDASGVLADPPIKQMKVG